MSMSDQSSPSEGRSWYQQVFEQITVHGWEPITGYTALEDETDGSACESLQEFQYPGTSAVLELSQIGKQAKPMTLMLTHPFDPSFGNRTPRRDREPFAWALADAHETVAMQYMSKQSTAFHSPDVTLSAEVPSGISVNELQRTVLGTAYTAIVINNLHAGICRVLDQYRPTDAEPTVDAIMDALQW